MDPTGEIGSGVIVDCIFEQFVGLAARYRVVYS